MIAGGTDIKAADKRDSMRNKGGSLAIALAIVLTSMPMFSDGMFTAPASASEQDDWKKEFEDICAQPRTPCHSRLMN